MNAQEVGYKPVAGDVTAELGLTGGLGNTSVAIADQGFGAGAMFKGRYFTTDKMAYRATVVIGNTDTEDNKTSNTVVEDSDFNLGLGFGIEKHFTGTERLSPYVGGDILIGFANQKQTTTYTPTNGTPQVMETTGPNSFNFGVRGVFGADYYFVKRVFLGVEAGLGLMYKSEGDTTVKVANTTNTKKGGSSFNITPAVVGGIRIGYAF